MQAEGFITYWAEAHPPHRGVEWTFFDGAVFTVLSWEEGAVPDAEWQAPEVCFRHAATLEQASHDGGNGPGGYLRQLARKLAAHEAVSRADMSVG